MISTLIFACALTVRPVAVPVKAVRAAPCVAVKVAVKAPKAIVKVVGNFRPRCIVERRRGL